jgi:hypothetical protein
MKALLIVLVFVVALVVGVGFYQKWFSVATTNADGNPSITFSADPDKIQDDKKTALEKMHNLGGHVKDKAATPTDEKDKDGAPSVPPPQE